ncbi:MAG TPA: ABC transporter substrate-binding protein [Kineosporiaceae bacterium]
MPRSPLHRFRRISVALVGTLLLAACGSGEPKLVPAPGATARPCGTLRLAENPWVGYDADLAVIASLARSQFNCSVQTRKEGETDSWKHLASGEVDAILENWGHDDLKRLYIDDKKVVVEGGLTGNKGLIGWYVPPWVAKAYPDITDWHNLNKYADMFRTAKSGGKGQLLDGDPTYVTNDAALVRNLRLDFTVVYAGSEQALIEAFRTAEKEHQPVLGYFYSPQWLLSEIPLVHVSLPTYTPGCDADPKTVACDYQPYDLDKIMNSGFARSGSPAAELIKNFTWTNDDQNQVARDITDGGMTMEQAAKKWLDGHRSTWQAWLPSSS